jgi:saccharopine dehydrogenase-like NADP-dependent oxidoreductase
MPQCGLAPGFISIAGYALSRGFDTLERLHMRVGALPQYPTNALKYNLTWSVDGLINEYVHPARRSWTAPASSSRRSRATRRSRSTA